MANFNQLPDLLIVGLIFLAGWAAHVVGSKTHIPRITLLLLLGITTGPAVLNLVPAEFTAYFPTVAHLALAMIGFLLGESLYRHDKKQDQHSILWISLGASLLPAIFVFLTCWMISGNIVLSLVLGGLSSATDPAATVDVLNEIQAKGKLSDALKSVVAIDDAWGVIIFSFALVLGAMFAGDGFSYITALRGIIDVAGAIALGIVVGLPMSRLVGRNIPGEPTMVEAMGFVFVCGGLALYLDLSYLLACMALGATVARNAKQVSRPFHEIERASEPFLVVFFLLSGMSLQVDAIFTIGMVGVVYVIARSTGKVVGARLSASLTSAHPSIQHHLGWCLLPQAGVAIGMALMVAEVLPSVAEQVLTIAVVTTVFFELTGPVIARRHILRATDSEGRTEQPR
ncbi:MAG: sodium:proton exchanger [Halieaceae bacterium]|jgi:Kef-type K+ transport system membrane component KefB|nr:sodium:proton exchanger [Halieaceae bacterium]